MSVVGPLFFHDFRNLAVKKLWTLEIKQAHDGAVVRADYKLVRFN